MKLDQLRPEQHAIILQHHAEGAIRQRLMDLGLHPQTLIKLVRYAPLGDPLQVRVGRASVSLRIAEAKMVSVELVQNCAGSKE
ncbi:FeoA family protein [Photobacterium kagoshimensis]|uniref:FeoA family protein n=1 Tax=Photobacterium kagoshimensis TaxID=2910242 RepID=UPI003D0B248D